MKELVHVIFDKSNDLPSRKREDADDVGIIEDEMKELILNDSDEQNKDQMDEKYEDESINDQNIQEQPQDTGNLSREWRYVYNHPKELIIGDPTQGVRTRSSFRDVCNYAAFVSHLELKTIDEDEKDHN